MALSSSNISGFFTPNLFMVRVCYFNIHFFFARIYRNKCTDTNKYAYKIVNISPVFSASQVWRES